MGHWIIDDFGELFTSGSTALTRTLGYTTGGAHIENYAIENIGHVGIAVHTGTVHIRCRPDIMADRAISTLLYWLFDREHSQIVVSWLDSVWHIERPVPCRVAISFLCHLMDKRTLKITPRCARLLSRPSRSAEVRWRDTVDVVQPALGESCSDDQRHLALDQTYNGRWTIVDVGMNSRQMTAVDIGDGYPPLDPILLRQCRTFNFADVSDTEYRDWVQNLFVDVARNNQPKFEDVDAVICWPRIGDMRTRYWRASVPLTYDGDNCRLLSVSGCDSSIELRPDLVQVNS